MLYRFDLEVFRAIHIGLHATWLDHVFWAFTWLGNGWVQFLLIAAVLIGRGTRRLFWPLAISFAVGGLLGTHGLKRLFPRDRPSNLPWAHPQEPLTVGSFPSGHTTSSFAIVVMLILLTRGTKLEWTGWCGLGLACLVGVSRIYLGVHWPTDVIGGACSGTFFACAIYLLFERLGWLGPPPRSHSAAG